MKNKKLLASILLIALLLLCICASATVYFAIYANVNTISRERIETTEIDINRFAANGVETKLSISKKLISTPQGALSSTSVRDTSGGKDLIKYDYYQSPVNDFTKVNYHSNSYSEIYYDQWIANTQELSKKVLFISGYYNQTFPDRFNAYDLAKFLNLPKPSIIEPQKKLVARLNEEQLLTLWSNQDGLVSLTAGDLSFEYDFYRLSKVILRDLEINFDDGSRMKMTITTTLGTLSTDDQHAFATAVDQTKSSVNDNTYREDTVLRQDEMDSKMLIGDKNLKKTLTVFIGDKCYEGDSTCDNFFQITLPYILNTAESKQMNVRIKPFIQNSGLGSDVVGNSLLCFAEQDKLKVVLLNFPKWSQYIVYGNDRRLLPISGTAEKKFEEVGIDQSQFQKCVNSRKYSSIIVSRLNASLRAGDDMTAIVRLNDNPNSDVANPTQNDIDLLYRQ